MSFIIIRMQPMIKKTRLAAILLTLLSCVGCDQVTKSVARVKLAPGETLSFFRDVVRLQHVENRGAFLSMGESLPFRARQTLFTFGGTLLVVGALIWTLRARRMNATQTVGAALICSGGLGNLIDRFSHNGYVTDFLNVGIGPLRTGIFNVADFALLLGLLIVATSGARGCETAHRE
jgi:signal peptidase II